MIHRVASVSQSTESASLPLLPPRNHAGTSLESCSPTLPVDQTVRLIYSIHERGGCGRRRCGEDRDPPTDDRAEWAATRDRAVQGAPGGRGASCSAGAPGIAEDEELWTSSTWSACAAGC